MNPRFCLALRESDSDDWDIAQLSMLEFKDDKWTTKDGMTNKPEDWCKQKFEDDQEEINDWQVVSDGDTKGFDGTTNSLRGSFKRKFIGSSEQDYTFFPNKRYQY